MGLVLVLNIKWPKSLTFWNRKIKNQNRKTTNKEIQ